jgi:hypothetical protein
MSETGTRFVGVDWSGAGPDGAQRRAIWTAVVRDGALRELSDGRTRAEATSHLIALGAEGGRAVVGLDFAFSLPAWWMRAQGHAAAEDLWRWAARHAADDPLGWLRKLPEPFWGTSFRLKPTDTFDGEHGEFRRTELESKSPGATPMSTFRLFGPGTVGAQGLRGHPCLLALQKAGFAIWPFEPTDERLVVEVFPRLLARRLSPGLEHLSGDGFRGAFLDGAPAGFTGEDGGHAAVLRMDQDAFDAAVSAWALWLGRETLEALRSSSPEADDRLEGRIWSLPAGIPSQLGPPGDGAYAPGPHGADVVPAAVEDGFTAHGYRLPMLEPLDSGTFTAVGLPLEGTVGMAPYGRVATARAAAERALGALPRE